MVKQLFELVHNGDIQYRLKSYAHRPRVSRGGHAGNARGLPVHPPQEERTKHKTKPRESRVLLRPRLRALNCLCLLQSCLLLLGVNHNTQEMFLGNVDKQKKQSKEEAEQNKFIGKQASTF